MSADLPLLAGRICAELVGRGLVPSVLHDPSADDAVRKMFAGGIGGVYVEARLRLILWRFSQPFQHSGLHGDAQIALGEYDTLLGLQGEVAA